MNSLLGSVSYTCDLSLPYSANCCPHSVLEVALSTFVESVSVEPSKLYPTDCQTDLTGALADTGIEDNVVSALDIAPRIPLTAVAITATSTSPLYDASSKATLFQQVVTRASRKAREFEIEQRFISLLAPEVQETVRASSDIYQAFFKAIKNGGGELSQAEFRQEVTGSFQELKIMMAKNTALHEAMSAGQEELKTMAINNRELQEAMKTKQEKMEQLQKQALDQQQKMEQLAIKHHEEIKQLQIQAISQLSVLQDRVKAVLTQTYELHEYPIPRLFVVLPQDPSGWDATNPFSKKFRLYFLCECGEHTKSVDSKTEEIHFAKHEGYEIARPTEFFQLYGSHVCTILKMLQFGISVAGVAVPAISHLISAEVIDEAATYLKVLKDFEPIMNPLVEWMDNVSANEGEAIDESAKQMKNKEALAGADLRKLDTFLKVKDGDKVLGNLYRTVTDEGHVKWVCIDHYRENYLESTVKDFQRTVDAVGGLFDKSLGRIEVTLRSRVLAEQFFSALGKARSVYELDIVFEWACTTSDLELLEVTLKKSRVATLRLDLRKFQTNKLSSTSTQYGVLFRFPEVPSMRTIHVVLPREYTKCLSFQPKDPSHPCKLTFELAAGQIGRKEFGRLVESLKTNKTLTGLDLA
ncbi:hypothetical protein BGZ72_001648, partial [Mortierella alpina]